MKDIGDKKKIMFVIPSLQGGGSQRVFATLAQNLNFNIFNVWLVVVDDQDAFYEITHPAVNLIYLKQSRIRKVIVKLYQLINDIKPDKVISTLTHLNILVAILSLIVSTKTKVFVRESTLLSKSNLIQPYPVLFDWSIKLLYPYIQKIICQSEDMKMNMVNNYKISPQNIVIINNFIHFDKPQLFNHNNKKPILISVGRLEMVKGYDRVIKALSLLKFDFEYWIIGKQIAPTDKGGNEELVKELIKRYNLQDKVRLWGEQKFPNQFLLNADVYLHGSYYEGFPNALLEAGACGLPIISFDSLGGIHEIVENGENGWIVPDGDIMAFSIAIEKAIISPFNREKNQAYIYEKFSKESIIQQYENLFLA